MKTMWSLERPAGGMAALQGGQLTKRKRKKARRGHGCLTGRTTTERTHRGQNCIAARTPINGPRGATLPVMEEQDLRIASLGGHPSMARGGGGGGGGKMPDLEEQM